MIFSFLLGFIQQCRPYQKSECNKNKFVIPANGLDGKPTSYRKTATGEGEIVQVSTTRTSIQFRKFIKQNPYHFVGASSHFHPRYCSHSKWSWSQFLSSSDIIRTYCRVVPVITTFCRTCTSTNSACVYCKAETNSKQNDSHSQKLPNVSIFF